MQQKPLLTEKQTEKQKTSQKNVHTMEKFAEYTERKEKKDNENREKSLACIMQDKESKEARTMKVQRLGNKNAVVITIKDKDILVSYETPVAYRDRNTGECAKTEKKWSNTTTRHINLFLDGQEAYEMEQEEFDALLED